MKNFNSSKLNEIIKTERKHNLFNWMSPKTNFWIKRLIKLIIEMIIITFVVFTLVFFLFQVIPGQPQKITDALSQKDKTPEEIALEVDNLKRYFHLDGNLFNQWLWAIRVFFDGTMGISWSTNAPVSLTFWSRLEISVIIGFVSIFLSLLIGIPSGIYLSRRENKYSDFLASILSVISFSIPSFVFALLAVGINNLIGLPFIFDYGNIFMILLPSLIISIPIGFGYTRYLRTSIRSEYKEQYVSLARIKGVNENKILTKHILKPALFPIINYLPFLVVGAFFGSITIETVFAIPGTGNMLITSALDHDQSSLLAITVFYTMFMVLSFFIRDLLITFVDPRVKGE